MMMVFALLFNKPNKPRSSPSNYRPISLISHLSKILEKIITTQIYHRAETNNILNKEQSGFRKNNRQTISTHPNHQPGKKPKKNQQLQNSIDQITTYSGIYRIGLNAGKTAQIFFPGKCHTSEKNIKHVTINNTNIPIYNKAKFLGVTFDSSLIQNKHQHNHIQSQTTHHAPTHDI